MLSRRQVLQSLAGSAASTLLPSVSFAAPGPRVGWSGNRAQIVDADFNVTPYLTQLKDAGIRTVGRYYDRGYGSGIGESCYHNATKILTRGELSAIERAGLSVYVVFQHCGAQCVNFDSQNKETADKGRKDAVAAVELARSLGQPARTPIYFAIDYDPAHDSGCALAKDRIWPSIETYFDQINEVFAHTHWQVGVYGAGATCQRLSDSRRARYFWLSTSLGHSGSREFFNGGHWHLFQNLTEIKRSYAPDTFDTDVANPSATYFGQWTSKGPAAAHDPITAIDIVACRAFVKSGCAVRPAPVAKARKAASRSGSGIYNATCRLLTVEDDGYFGISLTEDDVVDGYIHKSDIVAGGLLRNMPVFNSANRCAPPLPQASRLRLEAEAVSSISAR
jgi:hypothetical protein